MKKIWITALDKDPQEVQKLMVTLTKKSKILTHPSDEKKIKIVAAKYDLEDGTVTLFKRE